MKAFLKRCASKLPPRLQFALKCTYFGRQIKRGQFKSEEREFDLLSQWIQEGDWVLDVGANVGHYTRLLSELVGSTGRVIAIEPVPESFQLLTANSQLFPHQNVTLLNVAASDEHSVVGIEIPTLKSGEQQYYGARVVSDGTGLQVWSVAIYSLKLPHAVGLAKIDAEGHEWTVTQGMKQTIERDRPVLIVEDNKSSAAALDEYLRSLGYYSTRNEGSPNFVYLPS